jgi:UDP-3-O-[3-hydroxymyristoyl] glucosamine N-acyltransferase
MEIAVGELILALQEENGVLGPMDRIVRSARPIDQADDDSICFCKYKGQRALDMIQHSKARVIVCSSSLEFTKAAIRDKTIIQVSNPRLTYGRLLTRYFYLPPEHVIDPTAIIDEKARIGRGVSIGPNSYVGSCEIGDGTVIDGHVSIHAGTRIGSRVIIHWGAVVGAESFAFERNEGGTLERFPQIAGLVIGDEVEIGANSTICRGSLSDTIVGKGTKIDVLVAVTHGVTVGKHCIVAAGAIICGSSKIGDKTWIGPHACIREDIVVGSRVIVGAGAVVHKDVPDDSVVTGSPARPVPKQWVDQQPPKEDR